MKASKEDLSIIWEFKKELIELHTKVVNTTNQMYQLIPEWVPQKSKMINRLHHAVAANIMATFQELDTVLLLTEVME